MSHVPTMSESEELIAEYREAYAAANGHGCPEIKYRSGWFTIRYPSSTFGTRHRRREIEAFRDRLLLRSREKAR